MTNTIRTIGVLTTLVLGGVSVWGLWTQNAFIVFLSFLLISLLATSALVILRRNPYVSRKMFVLSGVLLLVAVLGAPVLSGYSFLEYFVPPFPMFYVVTAFIFFLISSWIILPTRSDENKPRDIYYYIPKIIGSVLLAMWAIFGFTLYFGGFLGQSTTIQILYKSETFVWIFVFAVALLPISSLIITKARPTNKKLALIQTLGIFTSIFLFGVSYLFIYVLVDVPWFSLFFIFILISSLFAIGALFWLANYPLIVGRIFICLAVLIIVASLLLLIFIENPNGNYFFSPLFFFSPVMLVFFTIGFYTSRLGHK